MSRIRTLGVSGGRRPREPDSHARRIRRTAHSFRGPAARTQGQIAGFDTGTPGAVRVPGTQMRVSGWTGAGSGADDPAGRALNRRVTISYNVRAPMKPTAPVAAAPAASAGTSGTRTPPPSRLSMLGEPPIR